MRKYVRWFLVCLSQWLLIWKSKLGEVMEAGMLMVTVGSQQCPHLIALLQGIPKNPKSACRTNIMPIIFYLGSEPTS